MYLFAALLALVSALLCSAQEVVPLGLHGSPEYVDMAKSPRWQGLGKNYSIDAEGWPQNDFQWVIDFRRNKPWAGPDFAGSNDNAAGSYQMSFMGQATLSAVTGSDAPDAAVFVNQIFDATTQITNVTLVINPGHFLFVLTFANTRRANQGNDTGLTNIHLYKPGYSLAQPQLFTNEFLDLVTSLKSATFRCFDTGINGYQIWNGKDLVINTWADRSLPTDAYWPLPSRNEGNISGLAMPWEIFLQICFQTNTPGWFNLPIGADTDYITNFALLLKNGNEYTKPYDSNTPFYIEYSNEVWNWGFSQSIYNEAKAKQNNLTTLQNYVQGVFQVASIFRQVFGASAMGSQVRVVCMWEYGNWNDMLSTLLWAQDKFGGNVNDYIWGIGEAPYVNPVETGHVPYSLLDPTGVDRIIDSMYTSSGSRRQSFTAWQGVATYLGINVVGYESGPSLVAGIEGEASRSPRLKDLEYRYYMENFFPTGGQTVNFFALGPGGPGSYGDWYMFEHWDQITTFVSGQPYPDLIVGYVLPWAQGDSIYIDASQFQVFVRPGARAELCAAGCWPYPAIFPFLLRTTTTGQFEVTFKGWASSGATFDVYLDNEAVKTGLSLPTTGGNITIALQISTLGLHSLALIGQGTGSTFFDQPVGIIITLVSGKGTPVVPSAPINPAAESSAAGVALSWEMVSTATSYNVQRSTVSGGPYTLLGSTPNTTYIDTQVSNDILYYYVVTASNSVGESALSPQMQVIQVQAVLPATPVVTISSGYQDGDSPLGSLGQAFLQWTAVPNAQSYSIYRISGSSKITCSADQLATVYYDTGIDAGTTYSYNVTANNYLGSSVPAAVSTTVPSSSAPGTPTALNATLSNGLAYLQWNQAIWSYPEFAELFVVEKAQASTGTWVTLQSISVNNLIDYAPASTSCYRVWGNSGNGGMSAQPSNVACL